MVVTSTREPAAAHSSAGVRIVRPAAELRGEVTVPGDKSITHRAVMMNAIASGVATVTGAGLGADCLSTRADCPGCHGHRPHHNERGRAHPQ